jgi:riboflavin kinase / FMN adenylyltransferase
VSREKSRSSLSRLDVPSRAADSDLLRSRPRTVAIGTFDGVHVGHRQVIAGCDTVLTFDPHPMHVLRPGAAAPLLATRTVKQDLLAALGVREIVVIPFSLEWAKVDPQAFIGELIVRRLGARSVCVGPNFRFGAGGRGDVELLAADSRFRTTVTPLVTRGGRTVSSSRIRALIASGDVEQAAELLGRPYRLPVRTLPGRCLAPWDCLAVPGAGRYTASVGGSLDVVTVDGSGASGAAARRRRRRPKSSCSVQGVNPGEIAGCAKSGSSLKLEAARRSEAARLRRNGPWILWSRTPRSPLGPGRSYGGSWPSRP